jgi:membrane protein DedA with SNARE-associated domain
MPDAAGLAESLGAAIRASVQTSPPLAYGLIALAMLLENVFPPIPSELIMPLAGYLVQQGQLQLIPVLLAGLAGTLSGAWLWYGVGRLVNEQRLEALLRRHGPWLGIRTDDLARSRRWFARHGVLVVFWGRLLPGIRPFVSLPAGIELMPQLPFLLWSGAGSLVWLLALTLAGFGLGAGYSGVLAFTAPLARALEVALLLALLLLPLLLLMLHRRTRGR